MNHRRLSKVIITLLGFELKVWNRIELVLVWSSILKSVSNKRVSATNDPVWIKEIQKNRILEPLLIIAGKTWGTIEQPNLSFNDHQLL